MDAKKEKLRRKHQNENPYGEFISFKNGQLKHSRYIRCGNDLRQKKTITAIQLIQNTAVVDYDYIDRKSKKRITEKRTFEIVEWSNSKIILKSSS